MRSERVTPTFKELSAHVCPHASLVNQTVLGERSCASESIIPPPFVRVCAFTEYGLVHETTHMLTVLGEYVNQRCLNWSLCTYK